MYKNFILIIVIFLAFLTSCKDNPNALDYNIKLSQQNDRVVDVVTAFFAQMENDDFVKAEEERKKIIVVCDSVLLEMKQIGAFEDDKQLVIALESYVEMQKGLALKEFKQLLTANETLDQINSTIGQPDLDAIANAYLTIDSVRESIDYKDSIHYRKAATVQRKFAIKHGFVVEEPAEGEETN